MPHRSDEALFAAFQHERDCHALAILFRRRADELLRLAVFLAPRPTDAEDLVQSTFLAAIARAETFRDGNRVMSWLCGILTNHARILRRAERRPLPQFETAVMEDPAHAALRSELRAALQQGIAELPEPYRSVLTLHLENGLDSREISQRLARPPATVRKQMERAIERLRLALPVGLATAFVAQAAPAQLARNAADAARFVDGEPAVPAPPAKLGWPRAAWTAAAIAAATVAVVWSLSSTGVGAPPIATVLAASTHRAEIAAPAGAAAIAGFASEVTVPRDAAPTASLTVTAVDPDDVPCDDVEVLVVRDDGLPLPERVVRGEFAAARTDATGTAAFVALPPGRYDVTVPGAVSKRSLTIAAGTTECRLELPAAVPLLGVVVDRDGRKIEGAEVIASESSCRGDAGVVIARSRADGSFRAAVRIVSGRLFARHPEFGPGVGVRIERDRPVRLVLEESRRRVAITVRDVDGAPVAGCYVAIAPRSFGTAFHAPLHGRTDTDGTCELPDPGQREATVLASRPGKAPVTADLAADATAIELRLCNGARLDGVLTDTDGRPLVGREVIASLADLRSNEPAGPLVARQTYTRDDGSFTFTYLPAGALQVRTHGDLDHASGLMPLPWVIAGADVVLADGERTELALRAAAFPTLRGRLVGPDGRGIAGWNVVAVPDVGVAAHRGFRTRGASTATDGSFEVRGLAAGERYQLGAFVPGAPRWRTNCFPVAIAAATAGDTACSLVADPTVLPRATLRCRVLAPDGRPAAGAEVELRNVAFQSPTTRSTGADGTTEFGPLAAGDYWLAIVAAGLGTRTLVVTVPDAMADVDAGTVQLEPAARLCVRVLCRGKPAPAGLRVLAHNELGDKFVAALTDARGFACLSPLPPGRTRVLVHGPGAAPTLQWVDAPCDMHWVDVDVEPATTVPLRFTFATADNPFLVNGPLHVIVRTDRGELVFEDNVGAVTERGRFDTTTGLLPGRYRVVARSLWGACAAVDVHVGAAGERALEPIVAPLRL